MRWILVLFLCSACSESTSPVDMGSKEASVDAPMVAVDWTLRFDTSAGLPLPIQLLGQYDLSGALFAYDQQAGMIDAMKSTGFSEWRVGVGRWEVSTRVLPTLTDGSSCVAELMGLPTEAFPPGCSTTSCSTNDLDLMASRDWFTTVDATPVTLADTEDDARYALDYVRKVIDVSHAFGAQPFVNIDLVPRALSSREEPLREAQRFSSLPSPKSVACMSSFTNGVSNAAPANAAVFAAAATGLVKRVVEGSGGEPGRSVQYWEVWNEPEMPHFWHDGWPAGADAFFSGLAIPTLMALDSYREESTKADVKALRFGVGSFAHAATAAEVIPSFDAAAIPVDFFSFHAYPKPEQALETVDEIAHLEGLLAESTHYKQAELVLAEWGPNLGGAHQDWDPESMDVPLLVARVLALGAAAGLDRAHHTMFYDFYEGIPFGLLRHDLSPKPLYHAYALLARVITPGALRLPPLDDESGRLEGGVGAVLASKGADGSLRVLLVNTADTPRTLALVREGSPVERARITRFDTPNEAPLSEEASFPLALPARSLVLIEPVD
ncbi:MAG: hypothetical protein JRH20_03170 [Deltaproteobacteria bacterium]|nr:hypothetical protein [Deltaproteobacteria bacterium]